jgi:uncharacterized protein (TIGR02246 family)
MKLRSAAGLLTVVLAFPAVAQEAKAPPDLEARFREFEKAFGAKDADKIGAMFVPDAAFINPRGERTEGREQVTALFRKDFDTVLKGVTKTKLTIQHVRLVTPELAFVDFQQELSGGSPPPGAPNPWIAHGVVLLTKQGGGDWMAMELRPYFFLPRAHATRKTSGKSGARAAPAGEK